jgi:hypothetical protein
VLVACRSGPPWDGRSCQSGRTRAPVGLWWYAPGLLYLRAARPSPKLMMLILCYQDYTKFPTFLEKRLDELDEDGAVRPTILTAANQWTKRFQKALLAPPQSMGLGPEEQKIVRRRCLLWKLTHVTGASEGVRSA